MNKGTLYFVTTFFLTGIFSYSKATDVELLFLGLDESTSPAMSRTMDKLLRSNLQSTTGINVTDYIKTTRFRHILEYPDHPTLSKELLATLEKLIPDSLLIMWGTITEHSIVPVRKHLFGCTLEGTLKLSLSIYNITERQFIYDGTITSLHSKPAGPVFFESPEKVIHISTTEENIINQKLMEKAVFSSISMLKSLLQSNRFLRPEAETTKGDTLNSPSIRDVFSVPSVTAQEISDPTTKNSAEKKDLGVKNSTNKKVSGSKIK